VKSGLMILLAAMAIVSGGGCAHMPDWVLRAHLDGYNHLHPDSPINEQVGLEE